MVATDTRTGKNHVETVTAVMVHHDSDLYDLKVRSGNRTAVIDTTSSHLFWVPGTRGHAGRWVKAGALRYGTRLRTPSGTSAVALGGWTPRQHDGWMWDLTITPSHDFYIQTANTAVLVHNNNCPINAAAKNIVDLATGGRSPDEISSLTTYAQKVNSYIDENGPLTVRSTAGPLRVAANADARAARLAAEETGTPFVGQAGHVPDTALTGLSKPPLGYLDMLGYSNNVAGGVLGSRIGQVIHGFSVGGAIP